MIEVHDHLSGLKLATGDNLMHVVYLLALFSIEGGECHKGSYNTVIWLLRGAHFLYIESLMTRFVIVIKS